MRPEIQRYLEEHGRTYTSAALRDRLVEAGYDPSEVDAALAEWRPAATDRDAQRRSFSRWAFLLHAAAFVLVIGLSLVLYGDRVASLLPFAIALLVLALLLGWGISALLGRAILSRSTLAAALAVPVISALLIGGSCLAIMAGAAGPPRRSGTLRVDVTGGIVYAGSGSAQCVGEPGSGQMSLTAADLPALDGSDAYVSVEWYPDNQRHVSIGFPTATEGPMRAWGSTDGGAVTFEGGPDAGTARFDALPPEDDGDPSTPAAEPLAGSVSWDCR